ncbi:cation transporter [Candidatus Bathyarchaeota archaeon]|nr:cation transporter [Candidatus Bathyarchaeota archaeon]
METKKEHVKKTEKVILNASKTDCTGCSVCSDFKADNLQHAIARLNGVSKVKVDEITGKVTIEYDTQKISFSKITERFEKLGYKVEIVSREEIR